MSKQIPEKVRLRCEMTVIRLQDGRQYDDEYLPYQYRPDSELEAIIAGANGDSVVALAGWYLAAKPSLLRTRGPHLIPGPLQSILGLPVRQVYLDKENDAIYRIDPVDEHYGRVTMRLLPPTIVPAQ